MVKKEILNDSQKLKFIEILLLVGSIFAAFKIPQELIWLFMLFIFIGLVLYVAIQVGIKSIRWYNLFVYIASLCFSATYTYLFTISVALSFKITNIFLIEAVFISYLFGMTYIIQIFLSKPKEKGGRKMWNKIKNYICTIIGFIAFVISSLIFYYTYNLFVSNNGKIEWSNTLAVGLSSISIGIALISMCISLTGGKRIRRLVDSDYENFMNLFENVRIDFIEEAAKRQGVVDRVNVEVLAWKSRQYFDRAVDLIDWIDESKLRHLSEYTKQLVLLLFAQRNDFVWNRDVGNIIKMYRRLWETGVINYAEDKIKTELLLIFEKKIGTRKPNENDLALFDRILTTISLNPDVRFKRII